MSMKRIVGVLVAVGLLLAVAYSFIPQQIYLLNESTAQFVPQQAIPADLVSLKAADCGSCHIEIYQEWQTSLHSKAFTGPFFTAYLKKDKGDPTCLICHVPLQNQSPVMLSSPSGQFDDLEIRTNPDFDAELQNEGVTCSGCHVRDGVVYGPYPADEMNAPHPVAFDAKFLQKSFCNQCHEVPSKRFSLMREGICSTGEESNSGPWADKGYICQNCHMPEVNRPLVPGYPSREGRKHTWPGGYSSHQLQKVFSFEATKNGQQLTVTITNSGAGHKAPTGDPDRFIVLEFVWKDEKGHSDTLQTIRFKRQVIWQPVMFVLSDNRLAPGESTGFTVDVPDNGALFVNGIYHVMSDWSLNRLADNYGLDKDALNPEWAVQRPFLTEHRIDVE